MVYRLVLTLGRESTAQGWFAGDSMGNPGVATSSTTTGAIGQPPWGEPHFSASAREARLGSVPQQPGSAQFGSWRKAHGRHPYRPRRRRCRRAAPAAALFTGVAQADDGGFADSGSNASVTTVIGGGVGGDNFGDSTTTQQVATGSGASDQNNTANVNGGGSRPSGRRTRSSTSPLVVLADSRGPARGGDRGRATARAWVLRYRRAGRSARPWRAATGPGRVRRRP